MYVFPQTSTFTRQIDGQAPLFYNTRYITEDEEDQRNMLGALIANIKIPNTIYELLKVNTIILGGLFTCRYLLYGLAGLNKPDAQINLFKNPLLRKLHLQKVQKATLSIHRLINECENDDRRDRRQIKNTTAEDQALEKLLSQMTKQK